MITKPTEIHTHEYGNPQILPIQRITNRKYKGTSGDKSLVLSKCKCGKVSALDYGSTGSIKEKWN